MKLGCIGLEATSVSIIAKLLKAGHEVHAWDIDGKSDLPTLHVHEELENLIGSLDQQKIILIHVPNRSISTHVENLKDQLSDGDIIVDLSDSLWGNSIIRHQKLGQLGIGFLDVGLGGGAQAVKSGYACFVGGDQDIFDQCKSIIEIFAAKDSIYFHPQPGAGHFIKTVHCGIEYGMMQAMAEGFGLLYQNKNYDFDLKTVARVYGESSTIASRLMQDIALGYQEYGTDLDSFSGKVASHKQGERTVNVAHEEHLAIPVIEEAVEQRKRSTLSPSYISKVVSMLRHMIGKKDGM